MIARKTSSRVAARRCTSVASIPAASSVLTTSTSGQPARLSREKIVEAAIEIADEEGVAALSMRRVARHLGAGTMSLYHYVHTKRELLALMNDAIIGELVIPEEEMPSGWRERVALIAKRSLAAWLRRPWMLELVGESRVSENGLRRFDQTLAALDGIDVDTAIKIEIMLQVDEYVLGFAVRESAFDQAYDEGRFERGLKRLLDGIEAEFIRSGVLPG